MKFVRYKTFYKISLMKKKLRDSPGKQSKRTSVCEEIVFEL